MKRLLILLTAILALGLSDYFVLSKLIDKSCSRYLDESIGLAAGTYATSRVLNAGVSTLQESTVTLSPWGVGIEMAPGQMLDPINDATERLSDLCAQSLGILASQRILILAINQYTLPIFYASLICFALISVTNKGAQTGQYLFRVILLLALLRISTPIMCTVGNFANDRHFSPEIERHITGLTGAIKIVSEDFEYEQPESLIVEDSDLGVLESIQVFFSEILQSAKRSFTAAKHRSEKVFEAVDYLKENIPSVIEHLTGLFATLLSKIIVQVFLIPLTTLYLLRWIFKEITGAKLDDLTAQTRNLLKGTSPPDALPKRPENT